MILIVEVTSQAIFRRCSGIIQLGGCESPEKAFSLWGFAEREPGSQAALAGGYSQRNLTGVGFVEAEISIGIIT